MGQVAIDLPDPLSNSTPAPGPGVDDLLAQLAGEEIDRLLAEADVERPAPPSPVAFLVPSPPEPEPPLAPAPPANTVPLAPSAADPAQLPESQPITPAAPPPAPIAQTDVDELDARVAQELNSLFTELDTEKSQPPAAKPQPTPAAATPPDPTTQVAVAAVLAATPAPSSDPVAQAQALEKQLLSKTLMDALGDPADAPAAGRLKSINFSFLLRPLEWLNAPLAACSDTLRESLGKVAIMTLINALAILLYVLFLRKH